MKFQLKENQKDNRKINRKNEIKSRQVHLDFHTSEYIENIGEKFSKENFQRALITGKVNSITLFAKCHHSWCYYPSKVGQMHPNLEFSLLDEQINAAHEIGVKAPIYITVGWSSNDADNHPEWLAKNYDGSIQTENYDLNAKQSDAKGTVSWKLLCPNGPYKEHIYAITEEICDRYDILDGLFYDICFFRTACWCENCISAMRELGLDPKNLDAATKYNILARKKFMEDIINIKNKRHKATNVFFNGSANIYEPWWHEYQTHYEIEDLPTVDGSYDKLPLRMKYFEKYGKPCVGMTGKFHTNWGEFGGFKTPDALKFECATMLTYGARCIIGDQMHPAGFMDMETYRIIGLAYEYVEQIEEYCYDATETTKLGILRGNKNVQLQSSDDGLIKILLENQADFNIVFEDDDFDYYDVLILADEVILDGHLAGKINTFVKNGGGLLLSGDSGLNEGKTKFMIDIGASYIGKSECDIDYVQVGPQIEQNIVNSPFLFYDSANKVKVIGAEVLGVIYEPYFNRTYGQYCSHQNTPYKLEKADYPAIIKNGNVVYIAHKICQMYEKHGLKYHKQYFMNALNLIYKNAVMNVSMPSGGRARFIQQKAYNRYILHLLYGVPFSRGDASVIEDLPELQNVKTSVRVDKEIKKVSLMPKNRPLSFMQTGDCVEFVVPQVHCHQIVVIEY